jgi:hypothetical protein
MAEASQLSVMRRGNLVMARNEFLQVNYNLATGTWSYVDKTGYTVIRNAYAKIILQDGTTITTKDDCYREFKTEWVDDAIGGSCRQIKFSHLPTATAMQWQAGQTEPNCPRVNVYLRFYDKQPYLILIVGVENVGTELAKHQEIGVTQVNLIDISPISGTPQGGIYLGSDPSRYHVLLDTYTRSPKGIMDIYDGFSTELMTPDESQYDGLLYDTESKRSLIFGFLTFKKWWSSVKIGYSTSLQLDKDSKGINNWSLYHKCENKVCKIGTELFSEPVYLNFSSPVEEGQKLYTQLVTQLMGAISLNAVYSGWSHWRRALQELNADTVVKNADWITKHQGFYPIMPKGMEYISIDLGWQKWYGCKEADPEKFLSGMKWMAEQIHARGLKAGICIVPFCAAPDAPITQSHPEYMLHDSEGKMIQVFDQEVDAEFVLLDLSRLEAQEYIRSRIRQIIDDWGYDLIKVDLLSYARGPSANVADVVYHDNSLTSVEVYRMGINLLKEVVESSPRDVILTSCCACNGPSIGILRSNYSSVGHLRRLANQFWEDKIGFKRLIKSWTSRFHLNNTAWTNDFGAIIAGHSHPLNEALVIITASALSGGIVYVGDDLTELESERAELFSKILPLYGETADLIGFYNDDYPKIWNLKVNASFDNWNIVGIFNWSDEFQDISFELEQLRLSSSKSFLVHEFWANEYIGEFQKDVTILDMPPRSVKLLCIREMRGVPQLLSTDTHFTQGGIEILSAGWDARSQTFLAVYRNPKASASRLFIYVPDDYVPASMACFGTEYNFQWRQPIYRIDLAPTKNIVNLSVHFGRTSG